MREIKRSKKTNIFKKVFIKLCRLLGYELIDQSNFNFPVSNTDSVDQLSQPGKKSISIGIGETAITRKITGVDIMLKTCTSIHLVSQNKKRIFEKEKSDYTFRTAKSLSNSALYLKKKFPNISIKFKVIDIGSPDHDQKKIMSFFSNFDSELIKIDINKLNFKPKTINKNDKTKEQNMASTMASIHQSFLEAKNCNDLVYFVEDDYIHRLEALSEMIFAYEKFSSIFKKELFLLSTDYPYLYKKFEDSKILVGETYHWRTVNESLLTFLTSGKMVRKYFEKFEEMTKVESNPFEKKLHEIYEKELCLSPIPSLSIHCTNINSVYGLSPNIDLKKLWNENEI